jgi:hypothetical protein
MRLFLMGGPLQIQGVEVVRLDAQYLAISEIPNFDKS